MKDRPDLLPQHLRGLALVGENIRLARLRRRLSLALVAERAGISRATLHKVERGNPGVAMGNYFGVLNALGLAEEILRIGRDDELGRLVQDAALPRRIRPKKSALK